MDGLRHTGTVFTSKDQLGISTKREDSWSELCLRVPDETEYHLLLCDGLVQAQGWNRGWTEKMTDWTHEWPPAFQICNKIVM